MINLRINNELMNGLVGRILTKLLHKRLGISASIDPKDIAVSVEGDTTRMRVYFDATLPTSELEKIIKLNMI